ncbi:outer membrane beta-barrel protein [Flammeovirga sp. MY04]|uniref:outer membrane beta-barrel protein n=1 Tax=Flammeovirga sp. MY04 TaxID=1191459 RepID=UPI0008061B0D|nr:outer membrane beta-barrel protein [Flammeovirga sp. MY04]ANQ47782.1 outer membrane beta-barrel protein [Flammeovirga sp. MY04]
MKKLSLLIAIVFGIIIINSTATQAQDFYLGGNLGNSFINHKVTDISGNDFSFDKNAFAWKLYGGIGSRHLGVEGGYRSLGKVTDYAANHSLESTISGWDVAAKGTLRAGPIFAFGKAGAFFARYENEAIPSTGGVPVSEIENNTKFLWGVGAGVELGKLELRLEWENMDMSSDNNLSMLTVGAAFHFGDQD